MAGSDPDELGAHETVGSGEAYSGFEDYYAPGADPFPCDKQQQTLYRGWVLFDLSEFNSIASATLGFNIENSLEENFGVNQQNPAVSYATTLGMSTGTVRPITLAAFRLITS